MAVTSWIRRQFKNGVITTDTLPGGATSSATTLTLGSGTSFPDGTVGPFIVTIDQGLAAEEKVLIQSRSGATLTVATNGRGYNGTTAQTHGNGAVVLHTIDAQDLDEANQVANQTLGAVQAAGDLLQGSGANALQRLARGSQNQFLQAGASLLQWVGFGVGQSATVGSANADGSQTTPARSDHVHSGVASFNTRNGAVTPGNADYLAVATGGLTGATAATRYVGGTASGAPASGTFAVGDFVVDQTGIVWVCTVAGTPGTWNQVGGTTDAAWTAATLNGAGGWSNQGAPFFNAGFRKVNGRIYLRGMVSFVAGSQPAFTLPTGYRPASTVYCASGNNSAAHTTVEIASTGTVSLFASSGSTFGLDGVSFDTLS